MSKPNPEMTQTAQYVDAALPVKRRLGRLAIRVDGGEPETIEFARPTLRAGRSLNADITIGHGSISKFHFSITLTSSGVDIQDLGSKNGLWFSKRRFRRMTLPPGDHFFVGDCEIELVNLEEVEVRVWPEAWFGGLYGDSIVMRELFAYLARLAVSPLDVLVCGESGTGKELTARALHDLCPQRAKGPFITLDCSSLSPTLANAVIFGVARGAFTGAERDQAGLFEQADGGTLFIDEIGELSADLQLRFLRLLDRREFTRLGEPGRVRTADVRIVAATNRNLKEEVENGHFRADLYHRIQQGMVDIPQLSDRGNDIILLAERELEAIGRSHGRHMELTPSATAVLLAYEWPGNVRELKNVVSEAAFTSDGVIRAEDLRLRGSSDWGSRRRSAAVQSEGGSYEELHRQFDLSVLPPVLASTGSIKAAAERLGISRRRLRERLKTLGLRPA